MTIKWARDSRLDSGTGRRGLSVVLGTLLIGGRHALLNDPGTPWHLRLGREILATGDVPRFDTLTFTHEHASWVDQSWAFDVLLALVGRHVGLVRGDRPGVSRSGRALCRHGPRLDSRRHIAGRRGRCCSVRHRDRRDPFPDSAAPLHVCVRLPDAPGLPEATPAGRLGGRGSARFTRPCWPTCTAASWRCR